MTLAGRILSFFDNPLHSLFWLLGPAHPYGACSLLVEPKAQATILHAAVMVATRQHRPKQEISKIAAYLAEKTHHAGILKKRDAYGQTALDYAIAARKIEVARAIILEDTTISLDYVRTMWKILTRGKADDDDPFLTGVKYAFQERGTVVKKAQRSLRDFPRYEALQLFFEHVAKFGIPFQRLDLGGIYDVYEIDENIDMDVAQQKLVSYHPISSSHNAS